MCFTVNPFKVIDLVRHPISSFNMLDNDRGIIVEDAVGRSDDLEVFVLQNHFVVVFLRSQVETSVCKVSILPENDFKFLFERLVS
jgi:hypothetical protein